ncbi:MAG: tol-pal system protein YbgF [Burkholderiaceae bacterium]|nr:MAG: tol-pal system protein YbgF [Burkholderiaceae bacterium]
MHPVAGMVALLWLSFSLPAHAGLFNDDEARRAVLELRVTVDAQKQELADLRKRMDALETNDNGRLELVNQIEQLRQENAKLRGQLETLTYQLAETQRRQKDLYADLEARIAKLEPQSVSIDGKEAKVEQKETLAYESAYALFKNGDFKGAISALNNFLKTYPSSAYAPNAQYWLGNSYYALNDFKQSIVIQQQLLDAYPDHPKAPAAMLNIASSQLQLNDKKAARKTLETLLKTYPKAPEAVSAQERLKNLP